MCRHYVALCFGLKVVGPSRGVPFLPKWSSRSAGSGATFGAPWPPWSIGDHVFQRGKVTITASLMLALIYTLYLLGTALHMYTNMHRPPRRHRGRVFRAEIFATHGVDRISARSNGWRRCWRCWRHRSPAAWHASRCRHKTRILRRGGDRQRLVVGALGGTGCFPTIRVIHIEFMHAGCACIQDPRTRKRLWRRKRSWRRQPFWLSYDFAVVAMTGSRGRE